jgi:hypothetical protein
MLLQINMGPNFQASDRAVLHQSGKVSWQIAHVWGLENPHIHRKVIQDSPKVNIWRGLMKDRIIGHFSSWNLW